MNGRSPIIVKTHKPLDIEVIDSGSKMLPSEQSEGGSKLSAKPKRQSEQQAKKEGKQTEKRRDYGGALGG